MESKHKNALIGALLAVVFVMAVGYAAFAQLLTINGTATVSSSWDVHFDTNQTTAVAVACHTGVGTSSDTCGSSQASSVDPFGTITYSSTSEKPTVADLAATLKQPGDTVTFTLKPTNYGSLSAKPAANAVITYGTDESSSTMTIADGGQTATKGNIQWEIVATGTTVSTSHTITGANGSAVVAANQDTIIVKATFIGGQSEAVEANQTANIKIEINYVQA